MICTFGEADCSAVSPGQMITNSVVTVGLSLGIFAVVTVIASKLGLRHPYSVMAICSLAFLAVPEAAAYNLVGASAAVLVLIYFSGQSGGNFTEGNTVGGSVNESFAPWWAAGSLAFGVIPVGWYSFVSSGVALPIPVDSFGDARFAQLIVPPFWLGVLALGLVEVVRKRSKGHSEVRPA